MKKKSEKKAGGAKETKKKAKKPLISAAVGDTLPSSEPPVAAFQSETGTKGDAGPRGEAGVGLRLDTGAPSDASLTVGSDGVLRFTAGGRIYVVHMAQEGDKNG